jgi:hypothetical protein
MVLHQAPRDRNLELLAGAGSALSVGLSATFPGLDRDRAFYPAVTIDITSCCGLFAVMGGCVQTLALDSSAIVALGAIAADRRRSNNALEQTRRRQAIR